MSATDLAARKLREMDDRRSFDPNELLAPTLRTITDQRANIRHAQMTGPPPCIDPETGEVVVPNLRSSFYEERPELLRIRQAAHSRTRSADAVLAGTLARISALTPPTIQLPAPVGTTGSLNVAVSLIGRSGTGKSSSADVAAELLPVPILADEMATMSLGSGEGLIEAYWGTVDELDENGKTRRVRRQVRRSVLFMLDEGEAISELGGRKGSTLLPTIRSAWSGQRLGQANASEERCRHLAPGEYRFALVAGFQTETAVNLINDVDGGTPQRFLYLAAEDPTIPDEAPRWPGAFDWRPPQHQAGPMDLDADVAAEIRHRNLQRSRGLVAIDPLDAHRDLSRLKVAGLLALLPGRLNITANDWRLAGDILDSSDRVRATIIDLARLRAVEAERVQTRRAIGRDAALEADQAARALGAWSRAIARHVAKQGCDGGCKRRCVNRSVPGKYRDHVSLDDAIDEAIALGWIVIDDELFRPGESRPA